jgi:peptidoglycan/xylan/chitin deacetylase (PgdA/CDA1 family)/GT2 family glycosyltransferase
VPAISVIIPTLNRPGQLLRTLESLSRQAVGPETFETIVVVDGDDPETLELLHRRPFREVRVVRQEHLGAAAARNAGADLAASGFLLFLDDDMEAGPGLVEAHLAAQAEGEAVGIGPISLTLSSPPDPFTAYFERTWSRRYRQFADGARQPSFRDCYGGNLCVPREGFLATRGFATDIARSHDIELGYRLGEAGLQVKFVPEAVCTEIGARDFRTTAAHFERAGRTAWTLYERHPPMLQETELGLPWEPRARTLLLFRFLLVVRPPFWLLALFDRSAGRRSESKWHGFLTRHLFWRGVRRGVPDRETLARLLYGTPILMYHAFAAQNEHASRFVVSSDRFRRQLNWLRRRGFHVLGLDEYLSLRKEHRLPPRKSVVITIDDGYRDNATLAAPILQELGFPATIFPVSGLLGGTNRWSVGDALGERPLLSWDELKQVHRAGIGIGGHTVTHPRLTDLTPSEAGAEITASRDQLERALGARITMFAYPFGLYDSRIEKLVEEAGFEASCSVRPGLNRARTPLFALRRTEIKGADSMFRFALAVLFGDPEAFFPRPRG